jgi:peptidyl-prolyl cis-trans isomerase D
LLDYRSDRGRQLLAQRTQELSDKARAGHDLKKAAREMGATAKTSDLVTTEAQLPELGPLSGPMASVFGLKKGEISGPIPAGRSGVVVQIVDRQEPSMDELAGARDQLREQLLGRKRGEAFELFVANLRSRMEKEGKIRVNQAELDRFSTGRG